MAQYALKGHLIMAENSQMEMPLLIIETNEENIDIVRKSYAKNDYWVTPNNNQISFQIATIEKLQ